MKTTSLLLTLTLVILGSAAKAQYIPGNIGITTNYYGGKGAYPSDVCRQKAKLASSVPAKNIQTPNKPSSLSAQVTKKPVFSRPSLVYGYTLVAGEDQRVYGGR